MFPDRVLYCTYSLFLVWVLAHQSFVPEQQGVFLLREDGVRQAHDRTATDRPSPTRSQRFENLDWSKVFDALKHAEPVHRNSREAQEFETMEARSLTVETPRFAKRTITCLLMAESPGFS